MRHISMIFAILLAMSLHAQELTIAQHLEDFDFAVNEVEVSYAGFPTYVNDTTRADYDNMVKHLRDEIEQGKIEGWDAVALFGLSYAAVTTGFFGLQKQDNEPKEVQKSETPQQLPAHEASSAIEVANDSTPAAAAEPRLYDNVPLEQMLAELSAYYQVDVEYRSDDVRSLRLYYEWEPDYSLDMVVDMLSHFESLSISREGNKLIVESAQEGK